MNDSQPNNQREPAVPDSAASQPLPRSRGGRVIRYLLRQLPTLLVLAGLGGLAVWGHHTGWKVPALSQLSGAGAAQKEDWCTQHNVPDSICIACHPELGGGNAADWCKEHGVPESKCTVCHPEILTKGVAGDWCIEHGVPESGCTICHEEIAVRGPAPEPANGMTVVPAPATQPSGASGTTRPAKPDLSLAVKPTTRPGKDPRTCQTHARRVQFASTDTVKKAGIKLAAVVERPMAATLAVNAESDYDRIRYAQVASPVSGRAWRIDKQPGQRVAKGEVVALVAAVEVGKAKAELLEALAALELRTTALKRIRESAEKGFRTAAELAEAEAALKEARIKSFNAQQALANFGMPITKKDLEDPALQERIGLLGLPDLVAKSLDSKAATANLLPLIAPFDGVVVERNVVAGELVEPSKPLFAIADTSRMWINMDVPQSDAARLTVGQEVTFRPDGARDVPATGKIAWISTAIDDQTRTLRVRAEVENPGDRLRARTFGRAAIEIRRTSNAIVIPDEAVQWEGCCHVAFVRLSDTVFQTRKLRIGTRANGFTEVLIGVLPGEVVVTSGSNVLKAEILKSNLGAGCVDD